MLSLNDLKNLLHDNKISNTSKMLLCLAYGINTPKTVAEVKNIARSAGLKKASNWNVAAYFGSSGGKAINSDGRWELTEKGRDHIKTICPNIQKTTPTTVASESLRKQLAAINDPDTRRFIEEAIGCLEKVFLRAAVVMSWVGALSVIKTYVVAQHLTAFNTAAVDRLKNSKNPWVPAKNADDLGRMKEIDFLHTLNDISVIDKNVKQKLENCLKDRNSCGHPNSFQIGENGVAAHIETLILNVFTKF